MPVFSSSAHFCHCSFRCYRTTFDGHHSDFRITSLLVHSIRRTSMPRGSPFPFHPTTIALFRYSLTPLAPTPSCLRSMSQRMGISRALSVTESDSLSWAQVRPIFIFTLTFSDWIRCTISVRRCNPQRRHLVLSPYSPHPQSYHVLCSAPRVGRVFFICRLSSHANLLSR